MNLSQDQIDHIARAHDLAADACCELVRAHREPGPPSPHIAALQRASGDLSAVCATLGAIVRRQDEDAKTERWRQRLFEQNSVRRA